jgi:uncharacterized protein YcfL
MRYLFKILLIPITLLVFMGCGEQPMPMPANWPITIDKSLQDKIIVLNSVSRKRSDNLSEVQFSVKNTMLHRDLEALYQVQWFDKDGFRIKSITDTFMKISLGANEDKTFSVISTSPKVLTYKIKIVDYDENKKRTPDENTQNNN